jgi:type IV pilus assembly protein PilB
MSTSSSIANAIAGLRSVHESSESRKGKDGETNATAMGLVDEILQKAVDANASDVHIEPMSDRIRVRLRCDGVLREAMSFSRAELPSVGSRLKVLAEADVAERRRHQGGRINYEHPKTGAKIDIRMSVFVTVSGENIVLRVLNRKAGIRALRDIGIPELMLTQLQHDVLDTPSGVVIVTGPTDSGKTTTLYSCVQYLNNDMRSIITAEDPVEYMIDGIAQCSISEKLGVTFEDTLKHVVRQDPDVIVLGEIRDRFSAETAIEAALTGHKVLATFHTEDSVGALQRLTNMGVENYLMASTLSGVLAQRLVRRICGNCGKEERPDPRVLQRIGWAAEDYQHARFRTGKGCKECHFTGYKGRVPILELLALTEGVRECIMEKSTASKIRAASRDESGMLTLLEYGLLKAAQGETTVEEVLRFLPRLAKPRSLNELKRQTGSHL